MKKMIIIVALILIGWTVTAQEIVRQAILPKVEIGMGYSGYGPLTVAGIGINYEHFSFTTGVLLISRVTELYVHQTEYMGGYLKVDINIMSMAQGDFESRVQFRPNILFSYGNKENTIDSLFEKEMSAIISPGITIGYEFGRVDVAILIQHAGLKSNEEYDGEIYGGLMFSIFI